MAFDKRLLKNIDVWLIVLTLLAIVVGCIMIYSATRWNDNLTGGNPEYYLNKQIIAAVLGIIVAIAVALVDYRHLGKINKVIYFGCIAFLLTVFVFGLRESGSLDYVRRWIRFGGMTLQPSEFVKYGFVIALASCLSNRAKLNKLSDFVVPFIIMAVPMGIVLLQRDLGTALVFPITFFIMLFASGANPKVLLSIISIGIFVVCPLAYMFILAPYQKERILVFLNPSLDPWGSGYNVMQSLTAIGSGGLFGKGLFNSTQARLNFLPAHHTDFIFSIIGEELGFVGAVLVLCLLFAIVQRGLYIARESKDKFGSLMATGIVSIMVVHIFINIGMTVCLSPCTGIPLPFLSAGGSSLISTMIGIGLLQSIHMRRQKIMF